MTTRPITAEELDALARVLMRTNVHTIAASELVEQDHQAAIAACDLALTHWMAAAFRILPPQAAPLWEANELSDYGKAFDCSHLADQPYQVAHHLGVWPGAAMCHTCAIDHTNTDETRERVATTGCALCGQPNRLVEATAYDPPFALLTVAICTSCTFDAAAVHPSASDN